MLSASDALRTGRRRRSPPSPTHLYHEYIMQRIESFKNSIPRDELMRLGDEARTELEQAGQGQFFLTEVLAAEIVDEYLFRRLRLPSFKKWQRDLLPLRAAQRQPTRWGLDRSCPVVPLLNRVEPSDHALVIGAGAEPCACLLAAHEVQVTFLTHDIGAVERIEATVSAEALSARFTGFVVQWGIWLPPPLQLYDMVVVDVSTLSQVAPQARVEVVHCIQGQSVPGAVHVLLATDGSAPEAFFGMYEGWTHETAPRSGRRGKLSGVALSSPERDAVVETRARAARD